VKPAVSLLWFFPPHAGRGEAAVAYQDTAAQWHTAYVDSGTGQLLPQRERLAHFLYGLHYLWHDLTGEWLYFFAGVLAIVFLLVVTSGVLVHWKNLRKQLHQFRPRKSRHALWADLHKVLGVLGLPFQVMYAYTGALIVLAPFVAQLFAGPLFGGDEKRATALIAAAPYEDSMTEGKWLHGPAALAGAERAAAPPSGVLGTSLDDLMARALARYPKLEPDAVQIVYPGFSHGYVEISGYDHSLMPRGRVSVILRSATGEVLEQPAALKSSAADTAKRWIRGLHVAQLGGFGTRVILFLLTLAGCATILSGNALWLVRREDESPSRSHRVLAKLTAGIGAGLWVAIGVMLVASRTLPWHLESRGAIEDGLFFAALVGCVAWAMASSSHTHAWWRQLTLAAGLFALTPPLAALHSGSGLLGFLHVPQAGAPMSLGAMHDVIGVDVAIWLLALVLGGCAFWLRKVARRLDAAVDAAAGMAAAAASKAAASKAAETAAAASVEKGGEA
jgi:uncharacterized iron-regulated membrane protein